MDQPASAAPMDVWKRMCSGLWLERDYGRPAQELFMEPEFVSRYVIHLAQGIKKAA